MENKEFIETQKEHLLCEYLKLKDEGIITDSEYEKLLNDLNDHKNEVSNETNPVTVINEAESMDNPIEEASSINSNPKASSMNSTPEVSSSIKEESESNSSIDKIIKIASSFYIDGKAGIVFHSISLVFAIPFFIMSICFDDTVSIFFSSISLFILLCTFVLRLLKTIPIIFKSISSMVFVLFHLTLFIILYFLSYGFSYFLTKIALDIFLIGILYSYINKNFVKK